ncbi:Two component regulator three Y domain-containing protein [Listeria aquatica]|uniref:Two component regulator three Y domain-containing protein n=1 Tax=Listeria aquatica TaxID=1494960 RepID=UPI003EF2523E
MKKKFISLYFKMISRKYRSKDNIVQYTFKKRRKHDQLIIVFSAFSRPGIPATYNYMATTKDVAADRLFILDDFGHNKQGGYYLFHEGSNNPEKIVTELINKIRAKKNYQQIICVGTSKGGYAAMYFGLKIGANAIISGAPQYFLGNYLTDIPEKKETFEGMVGKGTTYSVSDLNRLLKDKIYEKKGCQTQFYVHFSTKEHTYKEHIADLIKDLKAGGYPLILDEHEYLRHQEVATYFPPFLQRSLKKLTKE